MGNNTSSLYRTLPSESDTTGHVLAEGPETGFGGIRPTYLRYEMKNVSCTAYQVGGVADGTRPGVLIANNFEEIKVTYTEYDDTGSSQGSIETTIKVEG